MSTSSLPSFIKIHPAVLKKRSKMWNVYGRTDGRRTDDGRCAMTIAHSSLRLRWAKKTRCVCETICPNSNKVWKKLSYFYYNKGHSLIKAHKVILSGGIKIIYCCDCFSGVVVHKSVGCSLSFLKRFQPLPLGHRLNSPVWPRGPVCHTHRITGRISSVSGIYQEPYL